MLIEEFTIWLTGMPGAGKSTVARTLQDTFNRFYIAVRVISEASLAGELEKLPKQEAGLGFYQQVTIVDSDSFNQEISRKARAYIKNFVEIFLECPPDVCVTRKHGRLSQSETVRWSKEYTKTYVVPDRPEIRLNTETNDPESCASTIVNYLMDSGLLGSDEDPQLIFERLKSLGYIL